jgi:hypothetical protein
MRLSLPKRAKAIKKRVDQYAAQSQKSLRRRFHFVTVWKNRIGQKMAKVGQRIVRVSPPWLRKFGSGVKRPFVAIHRRIRGLLGRRPHRSFRLTRRRDYKRSLVLPGYWSFTNSVRATLWSKKWLFGSLVLTYFFITIIISGIGAQEAYQNLTSTIEETGGELFEGDWGKVGQAGVVLVQTVTTGLTPNVTEAQSVLGGLVVFFAWLTTVWLMRNVVAKRQVTLRDGIYNGGAPVLSTVAVGIVLVIQLLPSSLAVLLYSAASYSGLINGGVEAMLFWLAAGLLVLLSLYWITSTIIALVVVTLPGMYPFHAIKTAGDLIVGRRLRVLFRLLWLAATIVVTWAIVVVPIILFDSWLKKAVSGIEWIPIVPLVVLLASSMTIVFAASYVYLLYRKVVDDDARPV